MSTGVINFVFIPIDEDARNGAFYLMRAGDGHQYSAAWRDDAWRYASGAPVEVELVEYVVRNR